ncbi:thiol:disulfide interchange protein DsbA/DsbL [Polaromonas sp. YR568]|uniref:thiol:disulfide interchange protein DsbA/DsbL n=1 Tax=Polaromonas sp. YR568 TaxID=1855301 RepID=UPI00313792DF
MQRRAFSLSAASAAAVALGAGVPQTVLAQTAFKEGKDFLALDKRAPTEAGAGQIEVVEFFWYSCPHCNAFEPQLEVWVKRLPKDVSFRRAPVSFRPDFEPQQRLYYVLESLGKVDELQKKVFYAIHVEKQPLNTFDLIAGWAEKQGIARAQFTELYNSFSVSSKVRKATQLQDFYQVDGVPSIGVAGRYFTSGNLAQHMGRALQVTDYLIGQSRGKTS